MKPSRLPPVLCDFFLFIAFVFDDAKMSREGWVAKPSGKIDSVQSCDCTKIEEEFQDYGLMPLFHCNFAEHVLDERQYLLSSLVEQSI